MRSIHHWLLTERSVICERIGGRPTHFYVQEVETTRDGGTLVRGSYTQDPYAYPGVSMIYRGNERVTVR